MSDLTDRQLLAATEIVVRAAAATLAQRFTRSARPGDLEQLLAAIHANDDAVVATMRDALTELRPRAGWIEDEEEGGALPPGEWWLVDPVEGNVNHIHGMTEWGVTATLVRDDVPVLAVVHLPLTNDTYTALAGEGAFYNGEPMLVSAKRQLGAALVATGQAKPREDSETYRRIGASVTAMLETALLVRASVPATLLLTEVAVGRMDLFWQHSQVRAGLLAGALLVTESGGTVTDTRGRPWTIASEDFLASSPGIHGEAVAVLSTIE